MKPFYILLCLVFSITAFGQIRVSETPKKEVVGQNKQMGVVVAELSKTETVYNFMYRDLSYRQIVEYKNFTFKESDLQTIYDMLYANGANVGEEKTVELDNGDKLLIVYKKTGKNVYAYTTHISASGVSAVLPYLNKKQLDGVFGK